MVRIFRLGVLIVAVAGLAACSAKASVPKSAILDDFERVPDPGLLKRQFDPAEALKKPTYPSHDFDVATSGYASVTSLSKDAARAAKDKPVYKFIQGKTAAQVRFTVPTDYKKKGADDFPKTWETGFGLSIDSYTPLKTTDWSPYRYFDFRVYNPGALTQTLYVRYSDSSSAETITAVAIPQGESEVELPLSQLSRARLNSGDIKAVTLFLDTVGQDSDPVLDFDQLALYDTDVASRLKAAQDEGETQDEDEDWDSEDEDTVRKVNVVHPQNWDGPVTAQPVTATVAAQ